jgi:DNA repair exonuclease SbcCD ATPase subunit
MIKSKLKQLGSKFKKTKEPDQREMVETFISDLKVITTSIGDVVENIDEQFKEQVVKERSLIEKTLLKFPSFLQPAKLKGEESERKNLNSVKNRIYSLNASLEQIEEGLTSVPLTQEEMGQRIYEVAYPGQKLSEENITAIEERFQEIEKNFFESLEQVNSQMALITETLTTISDKLSNQGVVLENIDVKLDRVETKVDQARLLLEKISAKLSQNRVLLAFLLGAVVILLGALILL